MRQSPTSRYDTRENLAARDKALAIWKSASVEDIPFGKVIEMIYHAEDSAVGSSAQAQLTAERRLLEEIKQSHNPATLKELRNFFASRVFHLHDVERWIKPPADLFEMIGDSLYNGYTEFICDIKVKYFRSPASLLETARRRFIDKNPDFGAFSSFYSDAGK